MSYYELHQQSLSDVRLVSMEGLKRSIVAYQTLRLIAEENPEVGIFGYSNTFKVIAFNQYNS